MIDVNYEAEKSLIKTGYRLEYSHPNDMATFPCISFFNITEKCAFSCDNSESIQAGWIQVDIWAKKPEELGTMLLHTNEVLSADGWVREMSRDIPDEDGIYRKTTRYVKEFLI